MVETGERPRSKAELQVELTKRILHDKKNRTHTQIVNDMIDEMWREAGFPEKRQSPKSKDKK